MKDLFGNTVTEPESVEVQKRKRSNMAKGYAAAIGSGPDGETCRTCKHSVRKSYHGKNYWKCGLMKHIWSRGLGSDIRLKTPACRHWEAIE